MKVNVEESDAQVPKDVTTIRLTTMGTTWWDQLQRLSPASLNRISNNIASAREFGAISPKLRELIYMGVDAVVTHLYPEGLVIHVEGALKLGASVEEVIEVLQIACAVSNESYSGISDAIYDVLTEEAVSIPQCAPIENEEEFRARFVEKIGFWKPHWDILLKRAPAFFERLLELGYSPTEVSAIGRKDRALVSAALAAAPPVADHDSVRYFARAALKFGATAEELIEAVQLSCGLGGHAFSDGAPIIAKVLTDRELQA